MVWYLRPLDPTVAETCPCWHACSKLLVSLPYRDHDAVDRFCARRPAYRGCGVPFGHPFGIPHDRAMQRRVLLTALTVLVGAANPGTRVDVDSSGRKTHARPTIVATNRAQPDRGAHARHLACGQNLPATRAVIWGPVALASSVASTNRCHKCPQDRTLKWCANHVGWWRAEDLDRHALHLPFGYRLRRYSAARRGGSAQVGLQSMVARGRRIDRRPLTRERIVAAAMRHAEAGRFRK